MSVSQLVKDATREAAGNVQIKVFDFPWQSYFNDAALGQAIAVQSPNSDIVLPDEVPISGFGVGLHPDSQVPMAVKFKSNAGIPDSQTMILVWTIVYPHGCALQQVYLRAAQRVARWRKERKS
jgi:hypothetical protein